MFSASFSLFYFWEKKTDVILQEKMENITQLTLNQRVEVMLHDKTKQFGELMLPKYQKLKQTKPIKTASRFY